jgi:glycosyltransferase involved in cell wall biosynthesis
LGHDVSLFAAADAVTKATLIPVRDQSIRLDPHPLKSDVAAHLTMLHEVADRADDFDILHFHVDLLHFPMFQRLANRTVTTLHGRLDLKDLGGVYERWPEYPLVSISHNQRKALPHANWAATVHHGLPGDLLAPAPRTDTPRDYLAFLGRISPEKRPDRAIEIAKRTGITLRIAAKIDGDDEAYYREKIAPLMKDAPVEFVGEISDQQKPEFLSGAMAVLFPIDWPEPFGLVMIEAMACGTPVIAWPCGSVREIVDDGVTGILVNSIDEAVQAVATARTLNRAKIRHVFERRFSAEVMARSYLHLYDRLLHKSHQPRAVLKTA